MSEEEPATSKAEVEPPGAGASSEVVPGILAKLSGFLEQQVGVGKGRR